MTVATAQAPANLVLAVVHHLAYHVGICDHRPAKADQVKAAILQDLLGDFHIAEAAGGGNRDLDGRFDLLRPGDQISLFTLGTGRLDVHGLNHARGNVKHARTALFRYFGDLDAVLDLKPAGKQIHGGQPDGDGEGRAHFFTDPSQHISEHARAVLQTAAVFVGTDVLDGGKKTMDQISVTGVDLNAVHAGALSELRRTRKALLDLMDLRNGEFPGNAGDFACDHREGACSDGAMPEDRRICLPACMDQLNKDFGVISMHALGQSAKAS